MKKQDILKSGPAAPDLAGEVADLLEKIRRVESLCKTNYQMLSSLTAAVGELSFWMFGGPKPKPGEEKVG